MELEVEVPKAVKKLPYVPTEEELKQYYDVAWQTKNFQDMMIVKTLLYTDVRVSKLVPFPHSFKEMLAMHADSMKKKQAVYLFESPWKKKYTDRGIRKILAKYSETTGMTQNLSPHKLRHFLLTWLKKTRH